MFPNDIVQAIMLGLALAAPLAVVQWRRSVPAARAFTQCLLLVYLLGVLAVATSPLRQVTASELAWFAHSVNLVPFATVSELLARDSADQAVRQLLGNVVLFVPLGVLLPVLSARIRTVRSVAVAGLVASMSIEFLQLSLWAARLGARSLDIDDVILNTLGACLGFALWRLASGSRRMRHLPSSSSSSSRWRSSQRR